MLGRGRYCLVSWCTAGSLGLCLPREEESLPVHDRRILRDCGLQQRGKEGMATSSTQHDLTVI
jgi:hypothetical protein